MNHESRASAQSIATTRIVDGWSVAMEGDEPTILDEELGARLGFARSRKIRELIERLISTGILNDSDIRPTVGRVATGVSSILVTRYRLTETGALLVIARSDTRIAHAITRQVVQLFVAVRRGQFRATEQVAVPVMPNSPTLGDRHYRADVKARCAMTARCTGASIQRVHGWLRTLYKVSGVYQINGAFYEQVCRQLESWALGRVALPSPAPRMLKAVADPAQRVLAFPAPRSRPSA